ncbi:MAG TPA: hypothetical protein VD978_07870 [Azospirillum sp.]|nr:hypothetical protein [Azospirillum sp.]
MAVFKREGSPFWFIEFTYKGHKVRQFSGMTKKLRHQMCAPLVAQLRQPPIDARWRQPRPLRKLSGSRPRMLGYEKEQHDPVEGLVEVS